MAEDEATTQELEASTSARQGPASEQTQTHRKGLSSPRRPSYSTPLVPIQDQSSQPLVRNVTANRALSHTRPHLRQESHGDLCYTHFTDEGSEVQNTAVCTIPEMPKLRQGPYAGAGGPRPGSVGPTQIQRAEAVDASWCPKGPGLAAHLLRGPGQVTTPSLSLRGLLHQCSEASTTERHKSLSIAECPPEPLLQLELRESPRTSWAWQDYLWSRS